MMRAQRVREGEAGSRRKLPNGPLRAQSKAQAEYSATWGIRQLPEICRYFAKCTGHSVKQGGTAGGIKKLIRSSLTDTTSLSGRAFLRVSIEPCG